MLTREGPKVLEFNARFGDPEAQALLPLLQSDLVELALSVAEGRLKGAELSWREGAFPLPACALCPRPWRTAISESAARCARCVAMAPTFQWSQA